MESLSGMLGHWQFWVAVFIVGAVVGIVMRFVVPKLSMGGAS